MLCIDPRPPWQNGSVESFNDRLQDELLSCEIFNALADTTDLVDRGNLFYNRRGFSRALGKRTPQPLWRHAPFLVKGSTNESDPLTQRTRQRKRPPRLPSEPLTTRSKRLRSVYGVVGAPPSLTPIPSLPESGNPIGVVAKFAQAARIRGCGALFWRGIFI
jgi:hypothetical protein